MTLPDPNHPPDELHHDPWPGFTRAFYVVWIGLTVYLVFILLMSANAH